MFVTLKLVIETALLTDLGSEFQSFEPEYTKVFYYGVVRAFGISSETANFENVRFIRELQVEYQAPLILTTA